LILSHIIGMAVQIFVKRSSIYRYILKEVMWSSFELYVILSIRYYHRMIYILLSIMSEIWYKRVVYGYDGHQCPIWVNSQVLFWRSPSSPHQNKNTHTVHLCPGMCWWPPLICQQHTQPQFTYFLSRAGGHIWFVSNTHNHSSHISCHMLAATFDLSATHTYIRTLCRTIGEIFMPSLFSKRPVGSKNQMLLRTHVIHNYHIDKLVTCEYVSAVE
jgi:hypothetical protein